MHSGQSCSSISAAYVCQLLCVSVQATAFIMTVFTPTQLNYQKRTLPGNTAAAATNQQRTQQNAPPAIK